MVSQFSQNEADIIRTCGYIKDDQYIASVFGVSISKVRRLREKVPKQKRVQRKIMRHLLEASEPVDFKNNERIHVRMMQEGSKRLLDSLMNFFKERERKMRNAAKS